MDTKTSQMFKGPTFNDFRYLIDITSQVMSRSSCTFLSVHSLAKGRRKRSETSIVNKKNPEFSEMLPGACLHSTSTF